MTKVNQYYYKVKSVSGWVSDWMSWREVCSYRKQSDVEIVAKITKEDYLDMTSTDSCSVCGKLRLMTTLFYCDCGMVLCENDYQGTTHETHRSISSEEWYARLKNNGETS